MANHSSSQVKERNAKFRFNDNLIGFLALSCGTSLIMIYGSLGESIYSNCKVWQAQCLQSKFQVQVSLLWKEWLVAVKSCNLCPSVWWLLTITLGLAPAPAATSIHKTQPQLNMTDIIIPAQTALVAIVAEVFLHLLTMFQSWLLMKLADWGEIMDENGSEKSKAVWQMIWLPSRIVFNSQWSSPCCWSGPVENFKTAQ